MVDFKSSPHQTDPKPLSNKIFKELTIDLIGHYCKHLYNLQADAFKALGNPIRIQVIEILQEKGELCFSDILEQVGSLKSTLSQNLSVLVNAGMLKVRKDSRCNYYSLTSAKIHKASHLVREVLIGNLEKQNNILHKIKAAL